VSSREPAIVARGVCKSFGAARALDHVDLRAETGQVLALLGPNGAGKTTLVRILATLLRADAGRASVAGHDVAGEPGAVRSVIGLSGQYSAVDDLLTGRENLELAAELYHLSRRTARDRAARLLEQFSLGSAADRLARTYSGGMRRRLDLAASLIAQPPVLILDEPTTGLDPRSRFSVWDMIEHLADAGTTVLLTSQYLDEVDRLAHWIVVVDSGRVIAQGTAGELKDHVGGGVVVEAGIPDPASFARALAALSPVSGGALSADHARQRVTFPAADGAATLQSALARLEQAQVVVQDIGLRRPSLDDVFLALTGHAAVRTPAESDSTS
jgi:ABC-2 type transport system ATP-binding protein